MLNDSDKWEDVISNIARVNLILPEAIIVGGTASALYAEHRTSNDTDFVVKDLKERFDEILSTLESVSGWKTNRIKPPVLILGNFNGIETGIRQLKRTMPLETADIEYKGQKLTIPTEAEILRIKGFLIIGRNATRDYIDFIALSYHLGEKKTNEALKDFDKLYPQENNASALKQLLVQLSNPLPYDLKETDLTKYKNLDKKWQDWNNVKKYCEIVAANIFLTQNQHKLDKSAGFQKYTDTYRRNGLEVAIKEMKRDKIDDAVIKFHYKEIFPDKTRAEIEKAIKEQDRGRGMER